MTEKDLKDILCEVNADLLREKSQPFVRLMTQYQCAMLEVKTKLDVLNAELSLEKERNPIESITCRIKTPMSIYEKLRRHDYSMTLESIESNIRDVAGIRVICSFINDIYMLAEKLCGQDDVQVVQKKDYIKNPKPNGYRSLHLIIRIPVFLSDEKKYMPVEVQMRTMAMDFWASLEHKVKYKKEIDLEEAELNEIAEELRSCADEISLIDARMQKVRDRIEGVIK